MPSRLSTRREGLVKAVSDAGTTAEKQVRSKGMRCLIVLSGTREIKGQAGTHS